MAQSQIFLIDGVKENLLNPKTFKIPALTEINALSIEDFAKIGVRWSPVHGQVGGERFWVRIVSMKGRSFGGLVTNVTKFSTRHGYKLDDFISFERRHVLAVDLTP